MLLTMLMRNMTQAFRIMRNFITRPFYILAARARYMTNIGRYFAKLPSLFTAIPKMIMSKPKKREDYVQVGSVFMAKIFVVLLVLVIILIPVVIYLFVWPMLVPRFFTASYTVGDRKYNDYSGKVAIYYDTGRKVPMFRGRLLDGMYTDRGTMWFENGNEMFFGTYNEGEYDGFGRLSSEDAHRVYEGDFMMGQYHGTGLKYGPGGALLYDGEFDRGAYHGRGVLHFPEGAIHYTGGFSFDKYHGHGILYSRPDVILYMGHFDSGLYHGPGELYDLSGQLIYMGDFERGEYSGRGRLYVDGYLLYEGGFSGGEMSGRGEFFDPSGLLIYSGDFINGERSGVGAEYDSLGRILYRGGFAHDLYDGNGVLYNVRGDIIYSGGFAGGVFSGEGLFVMGDGFEYEGSMSRGAAEGFGRLTHNGSLLYSGDFSAGFASGSGTLTDRNTGLTFKGAFENGSIAPGELLSTEPASIYKMFEAGMREYTTDHGFYLYNTLFGVALRFEYANENNPARLSRLFLTPEAAIPWVGEKKEDGPSFTHDSQQQAFPDSRALSLLDISFDGDSFVVREVMGTVLKTEWMTSGGPTQLFVFETAANQLLPGQDTDSSGGGGGGEDSDSDSGLVDRKYYHEFGMPEIAPGGGSMQGDAVAGETVDAISAALLRDVELTGLRTRETNALTRLREIRSGFGAAPNATEAEILSDLHRLWSQFISRSRNVTGNVLMTLMAIDAETRRQEDLSEFLTEISAWLEAAEADFRTARIDVAVRDKIRARRDQIRSEQTASNLRLTTHMERYHDLTGRALPEGLNFETVWLLTDIDNIDLSLLPAPDPSMVFSGLSSIVPASDDSPSARQLATDARLALMSLHDAVDRYATEDKNLNQLDTMFKRGEATKYDLYDAGYERFVARTAVYGQKLAYAAAMLELDKSTGGFISALYRSEPVTWFTEPDWLLDGRMSISYVWMENPAGAWRLISTGDSAERIALIINQPWGSGNITHAGIFYRGLILAEGEANNEIIFTPPPFDGVSLIEIVFTNNGAEVNRAFIDGFANAGRFFKAAGSAEGW